MSIQTAIKEALKARHHQHRVAAMILRGGKPVATAHNVDFVHAEDSVLKKAWRSDIVGTSMLVIRVRKDGSLGMSRPCELCLNRIIQAGIKKVIYSNALGQLETIKLSAVNISMDYLEYHFINKNTRQRKNA